MERSSGYEARLFLTKKSTSYGKHDGLLGIISREVALFSGNAPELSHNDNSLCMTSATFSYMERPFIEQHFESIH